MRLLDLYCGAGGCSEGYRQAGFTEIVGVDHLPQKRYPFEFVQSDAIEYCIKFGKEFDFIHASPPCQQYSTLRKYTQHYPDLLGRTRACLRATEKPWAIENVPGAPIRYGVLLCGTMFGLRVYRHRLFQTSFPVEQPEHPKHLIPAGNTRKAFEEGKFLTVAGGIGSYAGITMGIDWMVGKELSQAIPPAYTKYIGEQFLNGT